MLLTALNSDLLNLTAETLYVLPAPSDGHDCHQLLSVATATNTLCNNHTELPSEHTDLDLSFAALDPPPTAPLGPTLAWRVPCLAVRCHVLL